MFLQGAVFWYAIEKLFMSKIGFDASTIAISAAIYSATALLTEVPSGILADRWSRRGVLILSSLAIAISSLFGAISYNIFVYYLSSAFWGLYISMNSGTVDSIIYDSLLEETGNGNNYEKYVARIEIISSIALVISAIIGGLIGSYIGLRETFWLSIPTALAAIVFFLLFKEPRLHLKNQDKSLFKHTKVTFKVLFSNNNLLWLATSLIISGVVWSLIMEMHQIWFIALSMPIVLFGPSHALTNITFGLGGVISNFIKSKTKIIVSMLLSLIFITCLIYSRNLWATVIAIFLIMLINYSINIVMSHNLHDSLPSNTRAGSMSAVNAVRRLLIIPSSIIFGIIAINFGVFQAGWFAAAIFTVAIFSQFFVKYNINKI
jgi:predicted MFS family arabinose efflux permease